MIRSIIDTESEKNYEEVLGAKNYLDGLRCSIITVDVIKKVNKLVGGTGLYSNKKRVVTYRGDNDSYSEPWKFLFRWKI